MTKEKKPEPIKFSKWFKSHNLTQRTLVKAEICRKMSIKPEMFDKWLNGIIPSNEQKRQLETITGKYLTF